MRGVSPVLRRGVALLVLILVMAPWANAARIGTPPGFPVAEPSSEGRLGIPPGSPAPEPSSEARLGVPPGAPADDDPSTTWELFLIWLQAQIGVPIG